MRTEQPADERLHGRWWVPDGGFRLVEVELRDGQDPDEPLARKGLAPVVPRARRQDNTELNPLRDAPTLCRDFAALDPESPEAMLAFANQHGWLGVTPDPHGTGQRPSEPLWAWEGIILAMREALELLDAAAERPFPARVAERIKWHPGSEVGTGEVRLAGHPPIRWDGRRSRHRSIGFHLRWSDSAQAARFFAQRLINDHGLRSHTLPQLLWNSGFKIFDPETGEWSVQSRKKGFELQFVGLNLAGILWLQVAKIADGSARQVQCGGCNGWIVLGEGKRGRRPQTRYHDAYCRTRASRARQARATKKEG